MSSVLIANLKFLASSTNFGNFLSIALHQDPLVGCLNILSTLQSSLCHCSNFTGCLFLNKRFKCGIIGAYHITLVGTLFLGFSPSKSLGSSCLILYHDAWHTRHTSKFSYSLPWQMMQSLGHACIFWISNPRGQMTYFAFYIMVGNSFAFGSIFFQIVSNYPNPLSDTPFFAFH